MSTNDNTSTLKSYVDSASGYVQNAVGSIIGSSGDQVSSTESFRGSRNQGSHVID